MTDQSYESRGMTSDSFKYSWAGETLDAADLETTQHCSCCYFAKGMASSRMDHLSEDANSLKEQYVHQKTHYNQVLHHLPPIQHIYTL